MKSTPTHRAEWLIFSGSLLNPLDDTHCDWLPEAALVAKKKGRDYFWCFVGDKQEALQRYAHQPKVKHIDLSDSLILPGFYDMHFHWVQDGVRDAPKENLLDWLSKYTWPYEAQFKNKTFSQNKARQLATYLLANGTLGGACYGSIHGHTVDHGLRHFVGDYILGNVLMTMNSPKYLSQTPKQALRIVASKSKKYQARYALTPRFAPTTHPDVMKESAALARQHKSFIQTHLSETPQEIDYVLRMYREFPHFKRVKSYTDIYRRCKLLGAKTIMGHGIYLSDEELKLLAKTKTAIAHCPTSNAPVKELGIGSGLFDFQRAEAAGVRWALASDIGGGPYLSMIDVICSFVKQNHRKKISEATYTKGLYRATQAGAELMKMGRHRGNFQPGKMANFILLPKPSLLKSDTPEKLLKRLFSGFEREKLDQLVTHTLYNGQFVYSQS